MHSFILVKFEKNIPNLENHEFLHYENDFVMKPLIDTIEEIDLTLLCTLISPNTR